jgi:hypothetical protein
MQGLGKGDAGAPEALMFMGLSFDVVLCNFSRVPDSMKSRTLTAIGLDSVRTASDVNLRASDISR